MSLRFFEGPAGSGKTTRLFQELVSTLSTRPLAENERVLALTKMHGSDGNAGASFDFAWASRPVRLHNDGQLCLADNHALAQSCRVRRL